MGTFKQLLVAAWCIGLGLFGVRAFAASTIGVVQEDDVSYAVTLVDASVATNGRYVTPVSSSTTEVYVKVTVSIPRDSLTDTYRGVSVAASPSRLMYRKHRGPATAWAGAISLTRDAPSTSTQFYPMPQVDSDGVIVRDPTAIDYTAVASGTDLSTSTYAYVGEGVTTSPARWESTFISQNAYTIADNDFILALVQADSTYEWYAASRYGLGSFARISDIQDAGRKMAFTDDRLWVPVAASHADKADGITYAKINSASWGDLGAHSWYTSAIMPAVAGVSTYAPGWQIINGAIGDDTLGNGGVQLLNFAGTDSSSYLYAPQIISPEYPDGIEQITFKAKGPSNITGQTLLVQYCASGAGSMADSWTTVETCTITASAQTFTVSFSDISQTADGTGSGRFRIVRPAIVEGVSAADALLTITVSDLLVTSKIPSTSFGEPTITSSNTSSAPYGEATTTITFSPTGASGATSLPRAYSATMQLSRRAENDTTNGTYSLATTTTIDNTSTGAGTITASLSPVTLTTTSAGATNVTENAFYLTNGVLTGALPGVYNILLNYTVYGSFAAGRELIDGRESTSGTLTTYAVEETDSQGLPTTVNYPLVLDLREKATTEERVKLHAMLYHPDAAEGVSETEWISYDLVPASHNANTWRVDMPVTYRASGDDADGVWAWFYQADESSTLVTETGYLAFVIERTTLDGGTVWYGQTGTSIEGTMPSTTDISVALTETLGQFTSASSAADVTPVVIPLSSLESSHIGISIDFTVPASPVAQLGTSYWQDFNEWVPLSDGFDEATYNVDTQRATADFNATVSVDDDGDYYISEGWIPDEGPLATTASFTETFTVGRGSAQTGDYPFFYNGFSTVASNYFRSWGASPLTAGQSYLRYTGSSTYDSTSQLSTYFNLGSAAEMVLVRDTQTTTNDGTHQPDAMVRLRGGASITPRSSFDNSLLTINGVGTVSFKLAMSIPYDLTRRVQLVDTSLANGITGYGVAAGLTFASGSTSSGGYSVSYFLENTSSRYELRATQLVRYPDSVDSTSDTATTAVVLELYSWSGTTPSRLTLVNSSGTTITGDYVLQDGSSLANMSLGLWVNSSGNLCVGVGSGSTTLPTTMTFRSQATVSVAAYNIFLGSAECTPTFRYVSRLTSAPTSTSVSFSGMTSSSYAIYHALPTYGFSTPTGEWSLEADGSYNSKITRLKPSGINQGRVLVSMTTSSGTTTQYVYTSSLSGETFSITAGVTDATLTFSPAPSGDSGAWCNILLDDITVTSWCGTDENRVGDNVPAYTDYGFDVTDDSVGFAAVGVWVRAVEDAQLSVDASGYTGEQCLLVQRSRQNTTYSGLTGEVAIDGITTTCNSLAIYAPYSTTGYGPVSFRYCIPEYNEFVSGSVQNTEVKVMLQWSSANSRKNYLSDPIASGRWYNASSVVTLSNTGGAWKTISIQPDTSVVAANSRGTLRLVMVTTDLDDDDDPYFYMDDFVVTDNSGLGTESAWTGSNIMITDDPVNRLYWKDRAATSSADPEQDTFARKSTLTQAVEFNDVASGTDTSGTFDTTTLTTPILASGVGKVSFAARLATLTSSDEGTALTLPVRLYIQASEDQEDADNVTYTDLTYVEVTNTVYNVYEVDLTELTKYHQTLDPLTLAPDLTTGDDDFDYRSVTRLRFRMYLNNEATSDDGFGNLPTYGRVLMDRLSVDSPVTPSIRVASVAFSNVSGTDSTSEFTRNSPTSQPIANASILRTMVALDREQLIDTSTIRVFFTVKAHSLSDSTSSLKTYNTSGTYSYEDVLGQTFTSGPAEPIYAWDKDNLAGWGIASWLPMDEYFTYLENNNALEDGSTLDYATLTGYGIPNTVELTRASGASTSELNFFGDLSNLPVLGLPANSLVQYAAWVVFKNSKTGDWECLGMDADDYTDFPWYFPRSLNTEIQTLALAADSAADTDDYFSPYYWVYSCLPGEVFINEFSLSDHGSVVPTYQRFVELCLPSTVDLQHWRVIVGGTSSTSTTGTSIEVTQGDTYDWNLGTPSAAAVPARREVTTASNRTFYTLFSESSNLYFRSATPEDTSSRSTATTTTSDETSPVVNAGYAQGSAFSLATGNTNSIGTIRLQRPTGGAEHILLYPRYADGTLVETNTTAVEAAQAALDTAYLNYQTLYLTEGFATEWSQAFLESDWDDETAFDSDYITTADHARRLVPIFTYYYTSDGVPTYNKGSNAMAYVTDYSNTPDGSTYLANSIATLDMGGTWVTRRQRISDTGTTMATLLENGPMDLSDLFDGNIENYNPTEYSRYEVVDGQTDRTLVQMTPRQINLDQYLIPYSGPSDSSITSTIEEGLGYHTATTYDTNGDPLTTTSGGVEEYTWNLNSSVNSVELTYVPLLFQKVKTGSIFIRAVSSEDSKYANLATLQAQVSVTGGEGSLTSIDTDNWATVSITTLADDGSVTLTILPVSTTDSDVSYRYEVKASFELDETALTGNAITSVSPYCGDIYASTSSARTQPWWGSGFGFSVTYNSESTAGAALSQFLILYPTADALKTDTEASIWGFANSSWAGGNASSTLGSLQGVDLDTAEERLAENSDLVNVVSLTGFSGGTASNSSLVPVLGTAYAEAMGYDPDTDTNAENKEPAIPFIVWGVYTVSYPVERATKTISFLVRQPLVGETDTSAFTYPSYYQPLTDLNANLTGTATIPYFYLYSTPPEAAWLNEVSLTDTATDGTFVEVVMPELRAGITDSGVPQTTPTGWKVVTYQGSGDEETPTTLIDTFTTQTESGSSSYTYWTASIGSTTTSPLAVALMRPCGAVDGGVWTGSDADGGTAVSVPTTAPSWMAARYIVAGETDSTSSTGSVQLVGATELINSLICLSSSIANRTTWTFSSTATKGGDNEGIRPDVNPLWNQVTMTSTLQNEVYPGSPCANQIYGFFESTTVSGVATAITQTLAGSDWVYSDTQQNVFSYRPRTGYRYATLTVPPDLIGHIMLIGSTTGALTASQVATQVATLKTSATTDTDAPTTTWLQPGGMDSTGAYRTDLTNIANGVITFNPDYIESSTSSGTTLFGDNDDYVLTIVFVDEPVNAQNAIVVSFDQAEETTGAWLVTQTFFAMDDSDAPIETKGGDVVATPIWSDEGGTKDDLYQDVHGWVYQPVVGDKIGMTAVINPELGLTSGTLGDLDTVLPRLASSHTETSLRPFLVWTLIPATEVPTDLFDLSGSTRADFVNNWDLTNWLANNGTLPVLADGSSGTLLITDLKTNLSRGAAGNKNYTAAGIIPMTFQGYCDPDTQELTDTQPTDPDAYLLSFRTMTEEELTEAIAASDVTGISTGSVLDYTSSIEMSGDDWTDGAVLRFAVVLADPSTGRIYDCQSISNFSSENNETYCPWYVPEASADINYATQKGTPTGGVSPYMWVYAISKGGVWLNEVAPVAIGSGSSVLELGMFASKLLDANGDYVAPEDLDRSTVSAYIPEWTLDGWKVQVSVAPLPGLDADLDTALEWTELRTIDLYGWVPYHRLPNAAGITDPTDAFELDYYVLSKSTPAISLENVDLSTYGWDGASTDTTTGYATETNFLWLTTEEDLITEAENTTFTSQTDYSTGALYAISLIRPNGVVEDKFLFTTYVGTDTQNYYTANRMTQAAKVENAQALCASTVRACTTPFEVSDVNDSTSIWFLDYRGLDGTSASEYTWFSPGGDESPTTFFFANDYVYQSGIFVMHYYQPYSSYEYDASTVVTALSSLTAQALGGNSTFALTRELAIGGTMATSTGTTISDTFATGSAYTLTVSGWNTDWFILSGITKNGVAMDTSSAATVSDATVYTLSAASTIAETQTSEVTVDSGTLTENTDYVLTFTFTADAANLLASGEANSSDADFLTWLLQVAPDVIRSVTSADGVTAAEKYWLGFTDASISAEDVALSFTLVGTHTEPDGTVSPAVSISLTNGDTEISELTGDGVLVLLGRESLSDDWQFLQTLEAGDFNEDRLLILDTECHFFRAVLISAAEATEMETPTSTTTSTAE